jgi:hypothetical protein
MRALLVAVKCGLGIWANKNLVMLRREPRTFSGVRHDGGAASLDARTLPGSASPFEARRPMLNRKAPNTITRRAPQGDALTRANKTLVMLRCEPCTAYMMRRNVRAASLEARTYLQRGSV